MLAIKGYYDGEHIVPEGNLKLSKNQKVIITVWMKKKKVIMLISQNTLE